MNDYFNFFIDEEIRAAGKNDDLYDPFADAIKAAFKYNPTAIFFITDGNFDPRIVDDIKTLNANKKIRINTIAIVKTNKEAEQSLNAIATDNGGQYKLVTEKELESFSNDH
jgi:hypothetical protein